MGKNKKDASNPQDAQSALAAEPEQSIPPPVSPEIVSPEGPRDGESDPIGRKTGELQDHPLSKIFEMLKGDELEALVKSVKEHGVREPIVLHEGKILDGRNRYRAALDAGVDDANIPTREFTKEKDGDPCDFVLDANLNRRHLNETQRGFAAAQMETFRHGGNRKPQDPHEDLEGKQATRADLEH